MWVAAVERGCRGAHYLCGFAVPLMVGSPMSRTPPEEGGGPIQVSAIYLSAIYRGKEYRGPGTKPRRGLPKTGFHVASLISLGTQVLPDRILCPV